MHCGPMLKDSDSAQQQLTLLRMHEHRQEHGVPIVGGGRRQRGVSAIRVEMLREQIVAITLSNGVLSFTRTQGERLSSGPNITSGTPNEFRSVFVYGLRRASDPALAIVTSKDGNQCVVYFACQKVACQVLKILPSDLERFGNRAHPPEVGQPRVVLTIGPNPDLLKITYRRTPRYEFGALHEPPTGDICTCGHHTGPKAAPHKRTKMSKVHQPDVLTAPTYKEYERQRVNRSLAIPSGTRSGRGFRSASCASSSSSSSSYPGRCRQGDKGEHYSAAVD